MILGCNFDFARFQVHHRVVAAVVSELQLVSASAESEADDLMSEADAEDRNASGELAHRLGRVLDGFWITWTVRQKHPVRLKAQDVARGGFSRDHCDTR